LSDIGKNAIIVRATIAPLIERNIVRGAAARFHGNAIFVFGTKDAVIQFNEVSGTRFHGLEGAAFDSDYNSEGTIIQYNYSHENGGGLANICSNPPRGFNDGTIIRYNVSRDEIDRVIAFDGPATNTEIYNNTIVIGPGRSPRIVEFDVFGTTQGYADGVTFRNNIIHNLGGGTYAWGSATRVRFEGNCLSGHHPGNEPADPRKIVEDPRFRAPREVSSGLASAAGYALGTGSPCLGSGVTVPGFGGRDFFGSPVPSEGIDRGAIQTGTGKAGNDTRSGRPAARAHRRGSEPDRHFHFELRRGHVRVAIDVGAVRERREAGLSEASVGQVGQVLERGPDSDLSSRQFLVAHHVGVDQMLGTARQAHTKGSAEEVVVAP
jgi:hypothetical protein